MARSKLLSYLLLYPASKVYGCIMAVRNMLFNRDVLHQRKFDIPVVVVGNISMGGSGKTPHTEYIVDRLKQSYRVGVLSRGYKRKTKGFVLATPQTSVDDIGDEPYQIYQKFRQYGVMTAVCEKRVEGIEEMRRINPGLNLVVLDDAFQHRYVKPTVAVVLMEYGKPPFEDTLLPFGRLREPMSALNRADVVIVTKCPDDMRPMDTRIFKQRLNLFPYQKLLFSNYRYMPLEPLFPDEHGTSMQLDMLGTDDSLLAVTGIANPVPFVRYLRRYRAKVRIKRYGDHHRFTKADMDAILQKFTTMSGRTKILVTTEKDAVRIRNNPYFPHQLRKVSYYVPVRVSFTDFNETPLEDILTQMLRTDQRLRR